jgi:hypothetical protein
MTCLMERLADPMEDGALRAAAASIIGQLERRIQHELVRQALIGHAPRKCRIRPTTATATATATATTTIGRAAVEECHGRPVLIEFLEGRCACDLLQLATQTLDLCAKLRLQLRVVGLIRWQMGLGLIQRRQRVLDANDELLFVGHLLYTSAHTNQGPKQYTQ